MTIIEVEKIGSIIEVIKSGDTIDVVNGQGLPGLQGPQGMQGIQGPVGIGFPAGGTSGDILKKNSPNDYDATWHQLTKNDVGLNKVDNTSDLDKPISTATQAALDGKYNQPTGSGSQYIKGDGSISDLNKSTIGLGNVDNTSDADKPISTATQEALDDKFNNPTGTILQYVAGDGSIIDFPAFPDGTKLVATVINGTGATIPAFRPVYALGSVGGVLSVAPANSNSIAFSRVLGFTTAPISAGATTQIVIAGLLENVDTSAFTAGATLYLGSNPPFLTATKPAFAVIQVGSVGKSNATTGTFMVNLIHTLQMTDLSGVFISSPASGHSLVYDGGALRWKNRFLLKSEVGLGNVDNTSDMNKPVSTAQQATIDAKVADAINNGVTQVAPSQNAVYDALQGKQNYFGDYTPEDVANKVDNFDVIDDDHYPSVKLVSDFFVRKTGDEMTGQLLNSSDAESELTNNIRIFNKKDSGAASYQAYNKSGATINVGISGDSFPSTGLINANTSFVQATNDLLIEGKTIIFGVSGSQVGSFDASGKFTANVIDAKPIEIISLDTGTPSSDDEIMFYETAHNENRKIKLTELPVSNPVISELGNYSKSPQVDKFTSSGTWTKPSGAKFVEVTLIGGSAGGGSGRVSASGVNANGGGGGGSSAIVHFTFDADDLGATETIIVGAKGLGGAAVSTNDTDGVDGTAGGETSIGTGATTKLRTYTANPGLGGKSATAGTGGVSSIGATAFNTGQGSGGSSSSNGAIGQSGTNSSGFNTVGGASGGGIPTNNIASPGGTGSRYTSVSVLPITNGGTGGSAGGGAGGTGVLTQMKIFGFQIGTGGGGGGAAVNTNGGAGGNGNGFSGGGGGGAARNGFSSGKGGDGTDGIAVLVTYF